MINLIVDGSSLLHRAYYISTQQPLTSQDGRLVGDIFIFLRCLKSYINMFEPNSVYVCWDKKLLYPSTNFRQEISAEEYKGQRDKSAAKDVYSNEDELIKILKSLGIKNMYPLTLEADDVIAWLTHQLISDSDKNIVVSADKDLLQLVSDNTIFYSPTKKQKVTKENFEQEIGMALEEFVLFKAIKGDASDNIKGLNGYGEIKSIKLAKEILNNPSVIKTFPEEQRQLLENNLKMVNLKLGYNIAGLDEVKAYQYQLNEKPAECNIKLFQQYCESFNFNQFLDKIKEWENLLKKKSSLEDLIARITINN